MATPSLAHVILLVILSALVYLWLSADSTPQLPPEDASLSSRKEQRAQRAQSSIAAQFQNSMLASDFVDQGIVVLDFHNGHLGLGLNNGTAAGTILKIPQKLAIATGGELWKGSAAAALAERLETREAAAMAALALMFWGDVEVGSFYDFAGGEVWKGVCRRKGVEFASD